MTIGVTLTQFLLDEQRNYPDSSGKFTEMFSDIVLAAKIISREVNRAGLIDILGATGVKNVQGEEVQKLDEFANATIINTMQYGGHLAGMASEEMDGVIHIDGKYPTGGYLLMFDPLDGSSNIDVNVCVGTIFSVFKKTSSGTVTEKDFFKPGTEQVAAGYVLYGSSTMLVYTTGHGVHGFTLDPGVGEFILSHEDIKTPEVGKIYSINEGNCRIWEDWTGEYVAKLKADEKGCTARYIGSLVSDFHRNLLKGGVYLYPGDRKSPKGKLRLLYEANPLAFIVEQAGGAATDGKRRIMDIVPDGLHQRVPLIIGSRHNVEEATAYAAGKK